MSMKYWILPQGNQENGKEGEGRESQSDRESSWRQQDGGGMGKKGRQGMEQEEGLLPDLSLPSLCCHPGLAFGSQRELLIKLPGKHLPGDSPS